MFKNIIYVLATACLFVGSFMTFKKEVPDYFYMTGTSLFLLKSLISFFEDLKKKNNNRIYEEIL